MGAAKSALHAQAGETIETPEEEAVGQEILRQLPDREMSRDEFLEFSEQIREKMRAERRTRTPVVESPKAETPPSRPRIIEEELLHPTKKESVRPPLAPAKKKDSLLTTSEPILAPESSTKIETPPAPTMAAESTKPPQRDSWWVAKPGSSTPTKPSSQLKPTPVIKPAPVLKPTPAGKLPTNPAPVNKLPAWPKFPPVLKPAPAPIPSSSAKSDGPTNADVDAVVDDGVDEEDEIASASYAGPKTVVDRPRSTEKFMLSETAAELALMPSAKYQARQKDWVGVATRACNYFVATALAEAKITTSKKPAIYKAASFDDHYLTPKNGWSTIQLATLKDWFKKGRSFDVVFQKDPPAGKKFGHIAIPIGLNDAGNVMVAEAVLNRVANRIRVYSDKDASNYRIFVRH